MLLPAMDENGLPQQYRQTILQRLLYENVMPD
jgi:hypothetical protein